MRRSALLSILVVELGCVRDTSTFRQPTSSATSDVDHARSTLAVWDDALGSVVAIPSPENGTPMLFVRDSAKSANLEVELFSHDSRTIHATFGRFTRQQACPWERSAVIENPAGQSAPTAWSLALAPGVATPVEVDGIGELTPGDSTALAVQIRWLVSLLPDDSAAAPFRGLPIVVRDAWRFGVEDSTRVAIAIATRSLSVESSPRGEVTTIIMEPDGAAGRTNWRTAYAQRTAGPEDRVEGADLLAVLRLGGARLAAAFIREGEKGPHVDVVQRGPAGTWSLRWSSEARRCAR